MKIYRIFAIGLIAILLSCQTSADRRIKLASQSTRQLGTDNVETIQFTATQKKSVAIFHFFNETNRENLAWLEQGISEMIMTDLSQARQLRLISPEKLNEELARYQLNQRMLNDTTVAQRFAHEIGVQAFICGRFFMRHDSLIVAMQMREGKSGRIISVNEEAGVGLENVFTMVDRLTKRLREELQLSFREKRMDEPTSNIAEMITKSVEAFEFYTKGLDAIKKLYWGEAIDYFTKAVKEDSTFALAYLELAKVSGGAGNKKTFLALEKAKAYSENLPTRHKLNIEVMDATLHTDFVKAAEIYHHIIELYPEDDQARLDLGNFYFSVFSDFKKAIEQYQAAVAFNPNNKLAYNQLGYSYALIGKLEEAVAWFQKYQQIAPDEPNPYDSMGEVLHMFGQIEEAIQNYRLALKANPEFMASHVNLVKAYMDLGDLRSAEKLVRAASKKQKPSKPDEELTHILARIKYLQGDRPACLKLLSPLLESNPYQAGLIRALFILEGDSAKFRQRLDRYFEFAMQGNKNINHYLDAIILSLSMDYKLDRADSLLALAQKEFSDPLVVQILNGYKFLLAFNRNLSLGRPEKEDINAIDVAMMRLNRPISWDIYWRYYFKGLKRIHTQGNVDKNYFSLFQKIAATRSNTGFQVNMGASLAYLHVLDGNLAAAEKELARLGVPWEKNWSFIGPFRITDGLGEQFWPEKMPVESLMNPQNSPNLYPGDDKVADGFLDIHSILKTEINDASYALLRINSLSPKTASFRFGANGPIKVWLNNELLLTRYLRIQASVDHCAIPGRLHAGSNYLLVKIVNQSQDCGFYFRVTDAEGEQLPDISFQNKWPDPLALLEE